MLNMEIRDLQEKMMKMVIDAKIYGKEMAYQFNMTDDDFTLLCEKGRGIVIGRDVSFKGVKCEPEFEKTELVKHTHYEITLVCCNCGQKQKFEIKRGCLWAESPEEKECSCCGVIDEFVRD